MVFTGLLLVGRSAIVKTHMAAAAYQECCQQKKEIAIHVSVLPKRMNSAHRLHSIELPDCKGNVVSGQSGYQNENH